MRAFFIMALNLIASTNTAAASTTQANSKILTQADTEVKPNNDRFLRVDATVNEILDTKDEERGIADAWHRREDLDERRPPKVHRVLENQRCRPG
nr:Avh377 [Phytophthora sojae]